MRLAITLKQIYLQAYIGHWATIAHIMLDWRLLCTFFSRAWNIFAKQQLKTDQIEKKPNQHFPKWTKTRECIQLLVYVFLLLVFFFVSISIGSAVSARLIDIETK